MNRLPVTTLLTAVLALPAAASADTIAADPNAKQIATLDGTIVWSTGTGTEQSLMQRSPDGTIAPVKGAPKAAAYRSLDLGRDASNTLVLTYWRCSTPARCTAFRDDLQGRRATFKNLALPNCALSTAPALWRSRTVYGLECFKRSGGRKVADYARTGLYVRTSGGRRRLPLPRAAAKAGARSVTSVDVRGRNVGAVYADIASFGVLQAASGSPATAFMTGASEGDSDQHTTGLALAGLTTLYALTQSTHAGDPAQTVIHRQTSGCRDYQTLTAAAGPDSEFSPPATDIAAEGANVYLVVPGVGITSHAYKSDVGC